MLKAYAEKYQAGRGWTFLTGKKDDIDLISKKLGLYSAPNPANPDGHTPMLVIGNEATGQWMRNSAVDNPKFLATTIGDWLDSWQTKSTTPTVSYAEAPTKLTLDPGQYTFKNHCAACHTIGRGDHLGPDLHGVATTRDREWLTRFIVNPEKVRASGDPIALALRAKYQQVVMPSLDLGPADAAVLIDYIDRESRATRAATAATTGTTAGAAPAATVNMTPIVDPYLRIQRALNVDTVAGIKSDARLIADHAATLGSKGARDADGGGGPAAGGRPDGRAHRLRQAQRRGDSVRQGVRRRPRRRGQGGVLPDGAEVLAAEGRHDPEPLLRKTDVRLRPDRDDQSGFHEVGDSSYPPTAPPPEVARKPVATITNGYW